MGESQNKSALIAMSGGVDSSAAAYLMQAGGFHCQGATMRLLGSDGGRNAADAEAVQAEAKKRLDEIYMYEVLLADRSISVNSLEARVPFGDLDFVQYVMAIDPEMKMNTYHMGKYLLRHAFEKDRLLPENILWRQKAAFSDAVGHSMVDDLKAFAEETYTDEAFETARHRYDYHCPPFTKESLLYREIFEKHYPGQAKMIKDFWMPNKSWEGCDVDDPSARALSNYGASGE